MSSRGTSPETLAPGQEPAEEDVDVNAVVEGDDEDDGAAAAGGANSEDDDQAEDVRVVWWC